MIDFAKESLLSRDYTIADKAIEKCYKVFPEDFEILTLKFEKTFIKGHRKKSYSGCIKYLSKMMEVADDDQLKDVNTYLYLMSMITELPDGLKLVSKFLELNDLLINENDNRYDDIDTRNDIRKKIYYQKFSSALHKTREIADKNIKTVAYDTSLVKIAEVAAETRKKQATVINCLARNEQVEEILLFYDDESNKRRLATNENYVVKIAKCLKSIKRNGIAPMVKKTNSTMFYDMIDSNDFKSALNKTIEMSSQNNTPAMYSTNYVLLKKIVDEIDNIKNKQYVKRKQSS